MTQGVIMFGRSTIDIPDGVPILSRGRHRNPRRGACFMEMASYLAGERWSDHPPCTHPLLASIARCVNDAVDDASRQQLVHLIPDVVGLNPKDPRVVPTLVRHAALAALPVAAAEVQNVMALAILTTERTLAELDGHPTDVLTPEARAAFANVPAAEQWARQYVARCGLNQKPVRTNAAAIVTSHAITGIARACAPDTSARLVRLLGGAIEETRRLMPPTPAPVAGSPSPASRAASSSVTASRVAPSRVVAAGGDEARWAGRSPGSGRWPGRS